MSAATMPTPEWADDTLTSRRPEHDEVYFGRQFGDGDEIDVLVNYFANSEDGPIEVTEVAVVFNVVALSDFGGELAIMNSSQATRLARALTEAAAVLAPLEAARS